MKYVFGPVPSRRLGISLGIDIIPYKTCSYNCIYCQCGKTTNKTIERKEYISSEEIINEFKDYLSNYEGKIDYITFSGSGEPTLNSKIGTIIKEIKKITSIPTAVLTNGSLLYREDVQEDLKNADLILPSLDAVNQHIFEYINRPYKSLKIEKIIKGLIEFRKIYKGKIHLEVLFCKGINDNSSDIKELKEVLHKINPDKVQLNTVTRPPQEEFAYPLDKIKLEKIKESLGNKAEIISEDTKVFSKISNNNIEEKIISILSRRPSTLSNLSSVLGIHQNELLKYLGHLENKKILKYEIYNQNIYYVLNKEKIYGKSN